MLCVCEFACTSVPSFVAYLGFDRFKCYCRHAGASSMIPAAFFAIYLFVLLHLTGAGTLHDALRFGIDFNPHQLNLIPFGNFFQDVEGHMLNVLLFVPLGLLVPMISRKRLNVSHVTAMAIATSAVIEISQLLNSRVSDIDDFIMNVVGALIGYGLFLGIASRRKEAFREGPGLGVIAAMAASAFLGRFLFYNEMGLAKLLLGF